MKYLFKAVLTLSLMLTASLAHADEIKVGDLVILKPEIRATPKSAPVSAGYLMIENTGDTNDRLVSATAGFSGKVEIHDMEMVEGVMRMRPLAGGLIIPAGEIVMLKKGGKHIMFMKLQEQMEEGASHTVKLVFENAGEVDIDMNVVAISGGDHSGHGEKKEHKTH